MQDYSRRTRYRPPAAWYRRISNRLGVLLTSLGLAPGGAVTLEVPGRRSGRRRRTPVLKIEHAGAEYLVALAGESEWARNVRAARGRAVIRRRGARAVRLDEVPPGERAPILAAYIRREADQRGTAAGEKLARTFFGVGGDPAEGELAAAAPYYPCFRITYLS
jgi:deazaflavin-dependent oxidoreductase (nitroreductase family)